MNCYQAEIDLLYFSVPFWAQEQWDWRVVFFDLFTVIKEFVEVRKHRDEIRDVIFVLSRFHRSNLENINLAEDVLDRLGLKLLWTKDRIRLIFLVGCKFWIENILLIHALLKAIFVEVILLKNLVHHNGRSLVYYTYLVCPFIIHKGVRLLNTLLGILYLFHLDCGLGYTSN